MKKEERLRAIFLKNGKFLFLKIDAAKFALMRLAVGAKFKLTLFLRALKINASLQI